MVEGAEAEDHFLSVSSSLWKEISDHGGLFFFFSFIFISWRLITNGGVSIGSSLVTCSSPGIRWHKQQGLGCAIMPGSTTVPGRSTHRAEEGSSKIPPSSPTYKHFSVSKTSQEEQRLE